MARPVQRWEHSFRERDSFKERSNGNGQHECARGTYCSAATVTEQDGERTTTPALTYGTFCAKCHGICLRALGDLPELWVRLHLELGSKGQASERVTMSRSAPLPLRADIDAQLREIMNVLASWDERLRLAARLTLPDTDETHLRTDHGRMTADFCKTLAAHLDTLLALPADAMARSFSLHNLDRIPEGAHGRTNRIGGYAEVTVDLSGADAGSEILGLHYRARSVLGETRMTERLDVPCPSDTCELLMLVRVQGSEYSAECRACGRLLSEQEYRTWVNLYASTVSTAEVDKVRASSPAA